MICKSVDLRDRVHANAATVREIVQQHGGSNPRIMGSVARGEHTAESDLDILVDHTPGLSLLGIVGIEQDLETLFGVEVDVVVSIEIPETDRPRILAEAVPI